MLQITHTGHMQFLSYLHYHYTAAAETLCVHLQTPLGKYNEYIMMKTWTYGWVL